VSQQFTSALRVASSSWMVLMSPEKAASQSARAARALASLLLLALLLALLLLALLLSALEPWATPPRDASSSATVDWHSA